MPKYSPLATRLEENASSSLTFTFAEISEIVGGLPPSAFSHRAWWANNDHQVQGRAWSNAGYGVESVDLAAAVVTFVRRMRESTEEEVDGFLAEFYDKHYKYEYGDVTALNFAQDWLVRHNDPRAATVEYDRRLFGSITLGEHGKGKRFSLGRDDVDEAAIAYFKDRSEHAQDLAYRAVYGDFLLSIGHKADRVQLLARTIAAYLDACDLFLVEGAYMLVRDAIAQALAFSATSRDTHLPRATKQARMMLHELAYRSDGLLPTLSAISNYMTSITPPSLCCYCSRFRQSSFSACRMSIHIPLILVGVLSRWLSQATT